MTRLVGGFAGDMRGTLGTGIEDMGRVDAASVTFSPTKPRRISGNISAADQLCFTCLFIGIRRIRHQGAKLVAN
jgi:hypothetical protein